MKSKNIQRKKLLLKVIISLMLWIWIIPVSAQHQPGPYSFSPYIGNLVWQDNEQATFNYKVISMDNLRPLDNDQDGLIMICKVHLTPNEDWVPLISFSNQGRNGNNDIEIYYSKKTVTVRRYWNINNKRKYYDYHLFDPLFEFTSGNDFEFRVYFTSSFMYLVSKDSRNPGYWMSPIFFGLDIQNRFPDRNSKMYSFIERGSNAVIKLGDSSQTHLPYLSSVQMFGFNYPVWSKQMQVSFSEPNPPISSQ